MTEYKQPFRIEIGETFYVSDKKLEVDLFEGAVDRGRFYVTISREDLEKQDKTWPNILGLEVEALPRLIEYLQRAHRIHSALMSKKS